VAGGEIIDLELLRAAAGGRRDGAGRLLDLRDRRRGLERRVDALERELRAQVVEQEELRRTEREAEQETDRCRRELDELSEQVRARIARADEIAQEFERVKAAIVELHRARAAAETDLQSVDEAIRREAERQRRLWHECRESTADLTQLRRVLGGVLDEVRHSLSRMRTTGGD
jgi:chromosome segregation ATPase